MKLAVSGKGGVGKTTVSANLAYCMRDAGYQVFAIDADPDLSLGTVLGIAPQAIEQLQPIVEMRSLIAERTVGDGSFYILNPEVDDILDKFSLDVNGLKFLKMGSVKKGGSACYCLENTFLNSLVNAIVINRKEAVLLDMGAGIEHLTRGTSRGVDCLVIVTEPSLVSLETAAVTRQLANEIGIERVYYIGNKIRRDAEITFLEQRLPQGQLLGTIHYNEYLLDKAMGLPVDETGVPAQEFKIEIDQIFANLVEKTEGGEVA